MKNVAVFCIEKTRDYTVMANHHLRNKELSLKAKGLLSLMLSNKQNGGFRTSGNLHFCLCVLTQALLAGIILRSG